MIKFCNNNNDIIKLWHQAFGDSKDDILFFINNVKNAQCLAYYVDDKIKSMLYLIKCNQGYYIYAACTLVDARGNGYMSKLLNYCKQNYDSVCLIPAENNLIKYYNDRKFNIKLDINDIIFDEIDEIKEYLFDGCELSNPFALMYKKDV